MAALATPLTREDELHWLALRLVTGLGARHAVRLVEQVPSIRELFRMPAETLMGLGVSGSVARSIASGCTFDEAVSQHEKLGRAGAELVPYADPRYPPLLKEIYDPPPVLFAQGKTELLAGVGVGVVGSRRATPYGLAVSERLAGEIAVQGVAVVSGMARGIDTAAHLGALNVTGATIAVFGSGLDHIYPAENRKLAARIAADGLLLTEFPFETPAHPQNFPIRNRIIAGMSYGVLVVEGAEYSGSLITARLALDQGREVFSVPGNLTSKTSFGPNLLIKQGAHLVQDWYDIVENLPLAVRTRLTALRRDAPAGPCRQAALLFGPSGPLRAQLLSYLSVDSPIGLDDLVARPCEASPSEILAALFDLELGGLVKQLPGKRYVKTFS
jgi:DNA processing protein